MPSPISWMRRRKPAPPPPPPQPPRPMRPHVVALLPWLLVATGPLLPADLPVVATEHGLSVVAQLRLRIAAHRHIAVPGAPQGSPLTDLAQCICALHRSALGVGLSESTGAAGARKAVLLYCTAHPARWAPQVATLVVAYLHLLARLGLHESAIKVTRALRTPPDLVRRPRTQCGTTSHTRARALSDRRQHDAAGANLDDMVAGGAGRLVVTGAGAPVQAVP